MRHNIFFRGSAIAEQQMEAVRKYLGEQLWKKAGRGGAVERCAGSRLSSIHQEQIYLKRNWLCVLWAGGTEEVLPGLCKATDDSKAKFRQSSRSFLHLCTCAHLLSVGPPLCLYLTLIYLSASPGDNWALLLVLSCWP